MLTLRQEDIWKLDSCLVNSAVVEFACSLLCLCGFSPGTWLSFTVQKHVSLGQLETLKMSVKSARDGL